VSADIDTSLVVYGEITYNPQRTSMNGTGTLTENLDVIVKRFQRGSTLAQGASSLLAGLVLLLLSSVLFYVTADATGHVESSHWWSVLAVVLIAVAGFLIVAGVGISAMLLVRGLLLLGAAGMRKMFRD